MPVVKAQKSSPTRLQDEILQLIHRTGLRGMTRVDVEEIGYSPDRLRELEAQQRLVQTADNRRGHAVFVSAEHLKQVPESQPMWCASGIHDAKYFLVNTLTQFEQFYSELVKQKVVAVDTETSGLDWVKAEACGLVFGWGRDNNYYIPINHQGMHNIALTDIRERLVDYLADETVVKLFWNAKFDQHFLRKAGIEVAQPINDGVIQFHILDENLSKDLKDVAVMYWGPEAASHETVLQKFRADEAKRRRSAFSELIKQRLFERREFWEAEFFKTCPMIKFSGLKKQQINARLKAFVKDSLSHHPYANNKKEHITYDMVPLDIMTPYACADVYYTYMLYEPYKKAIQKEDSFVSLYENEMALSSALFEVESHGIKADVPYTKNLIPEFEEQSAELEKQIYADVGYKFSMGSGPQLVDALLYAGCNLKKLTDGGKKARRALKTETNEEEIEKLKKKIVFATDKDTLEELATQHAFATKIVEWRNTQKLLNTYAKNIIVMVDDRHYLHTTFNQNVTTGRMSSREPNLQNIPGRNLAIRTAFTLPEEIGFENSGPNSEWVFIFMDYSQVELRLTAHCSQDPTLLAAYPWQGEDQDVHSITCAEAVMDMSLDDFMKVYGDEKHPDHKEYKWFRNIAKRVNFGIIYGAEGPTIQRQVSTPDRPVSIKECDHYISKYFAKYPGVKAWIDHTTSLLRHHGAVKNSFGRVRRLPVARNGFDWQIERAARQGVNFLIQGDAADVFKHAVVRVKKFLDEQNAKTKMVNYVHDEIQFYWHQSELHLLKPVKKLMEEFPQFTVPIKVDIEYSRREWSEKRDLKAAA